MISCNISVIQQNFVNEFTRHLIDLRHNWFVRKILWVLLYCFYRVLFWKAPRKHLTVPAPIHFLRVAPGVAQMHVQLSWKPLLSPAITLNSLSPRSLLSPAISYHPLSPAITHYHLKSWKYIFRGLFIEFQGILGWRQTPSFARSSRET